MICSFNDVLDVIHLISKIVNLTANLAGRLDYLMAGRHVMKDEVDTNIRIIHDR